MIRVFIAEDEKPARDKLIAMLKKYPYPTEVVATATKVSQCVEWFGKNAQPDLLLMDIQLTDGLALSLFRHITVTCPVIFTTAFDQYILEALEHNGIDYLLKPLKQDKLNRALDKYFRLRSHFSGNLAQLLQTIQGNSTYKTRITVKDGIGFIAIPVEEIAFFYTEYKIVFLVTVSSKKFIVDETLAKIETQLDPKRFFRLNRKFITKIETVRRFRPFEKGKYLVELNPAVKEDVIISQEKSGAFKKWIDGAGINLTAVGNIPV